MPLRPRHAPRAARAGLMRHWTLWAGFPLALALILGYVCVLKSGRWLVASDPFDKATWAVVLAGESRESERADAALQLYFDGRIDSLIYSSNRIFKRRWASELLTEYLAQEGFPRDKIFEFRQDAFSTLEEARLLIRQFRYQNLDTVVVITVNFHTARSRRIFRELAQGYPHILIYPAETPYFDPDTWWSSREGRKIWLLEWTKTVASWFELLGTTPEVGKAESNALVGGIHGAGVPTPLPGPSVSDSATVQDTAARDTALFGAGDTAATSAAPGPGVDTSSTARIPGAVPEAVTADGPAPVNKVKANKAPASDKQTRGGTGASEARDALPSKREKASAAKPAVKPASARKSAEKPAEKPKESDKKKGPR